jgi:hypothetical protein
MQHCRLVCHFAMGPYATLPSVAAFPISWDTDRKAFVGLPFPFSGQHPPVFLTSLSTSTLQFDGSERLMKAST